MVRSVAKVQIKDLIYNNGTVFYADNPNEYPNMLPEYITTTERGGHEWVWVVYFTKKNPYIKPQPAYRPLPRSLGNLINNNDDCLRGQESAIMSAKELKSFYIGFLVECPYCNFKNGVFTGRVPVDQHGMNVLCLLYTSPSPRDRS